MRDPEDGAQATPKVIGSLPEVNKRVLNPLCMKPSLRLLERQQSGEAGRYAEVSRRVLDPVDNQKRQLCIPGTGFPWIHGVPAFLCPSVYLLFSGHPRALSLRWGEMGWHPLHIPCIVLFGS